MRANTLCLTLICLSGCNAEQQPETNAEAAQSISQSIQQPLEQAKEAERQIFESAERQKKQMEEQ